MKFGYLAFEGFENELISEMKYRNAKEVIRKDRLFLLDEDLELAWAQLKLSDLVKINIQSINNAAEKLKSEKKMWAAYSYQFHRRTELIQEKIYRRKHKRIKFLSTIPKDSFGFWCLLDEKTILKCSTTESSFPLGLVEFEEDKVTPPSRAYTKLWEVFTVQITPPKKNQRVLDMGSCPGGWTWVLQNLGCQVLSVDKAPLDPRIEKLPNIEFIKKDAFKLSPKDVKKPDWFFSDIICDPKDLLVMVKNWINYYPDLKFVCTLKYKGQTDFKTTDEFLKIPGSRMIHLCHNKHEVTWIKE